ncbi:hypothetical protein P154DRAFT_524886 [Amniculicola lignicola CBS 123094]|uniref:BTB domain-containing protein n=1 Tax=Amniculicola lignicola CBS 123094 TaxID=1392246 RepID=A0A6A5W677_9PLEO|nr:hypothetical protein P154DRAFT_524886 [Amniculicola lignicola CBS 123094]
MSGYLWKYYLEDDVDNFRHVLENSAHAVRPGTQKGFAGWQGGGFGAAVNSSPGSYSASPSMSTRGKKAMSHSTVSLTRADINSRDGSGMTILHHAASSLADTALGFAQALLEHPLTDLYAQDAENGWTSLHRAFYFGNIAIARLILSRDARDILGHGSTGFNQYARGLVKIKDKEGYGPLDLFSMTIKDRTLRPEEDSPAEEDSDDEVARGDSGDRDEETRRTIVAPSVLLKGDEVFTFGSNKNVTLGFGDEDDRQFPERITLRRPDHLLQRFYCEHKEKQKQMLALFNLPFPGSSTAPLKVITELPIHIRNTRLVIQDVQMSKLHTAVLTTDPVSNLYMCGHGPGGRLGTGNETTRYQFTCIEGGGLGQKKIGAVALGQNHTLATTDEGEIYSWGNNAFGQLGYSLPTPNIKDDDPMSTIPRQIFGPLKREIITGIAASRIHSVVHSATSLYTFGKNEGQLGIVDSDARSLDMQIIPRKIAASLFSAPIMSVSAIDGASICLLENHEVWVFANYGYTRLIFPLDGFTNYFLKESWLATKYDTAPNKISKIASGGDTVCALSTSGEVFTVAVSRRSEASSDTTTSTTNPKQIRSALSVPYRIWSAKRGHMAARDVDVDQDGSIILTTEVGSVWRRTIRATFKNATAAASSDVRPKDYKFLRVPGLTRVIAVRASAFGAYAAIRKDCDVTRTQIGVDQPRLWSDLSPLLSFNDLANYEEASDDEDPAPRFWQRPSNEQSLRKRSLKSKDLETEVGEILRQSQLSTEFSYNMEFATTRSEVRIPVHESIMSGRSRIFRRAMVNFRQSDEGLYELSDILSIKHSSGKIAVVFQDLDFLTVFNLAQYAYTDTVVDFWNVARAFPNMASRYSATRIELMKIASRLELRRLELSVRQMVRPGQCLDADMVMAVKDSSFFQSGDIIIELADGEMTLHSDILCQRCPFFEGLFRGRAGGQWLAGRRTEESKVRIDLTHVETQLFELVVRHIYTDAGEELFDDVTSEDFNDLLALDELLDHVMDVMSVANELMLDRLSQICQRLIGRYANARNVCSLLNAIAPSSVAEFKDAASEYICLSLEAVMQNGSLDELDPDLLQELNQVVRANQLACLPFARSGRAESLLFDKYPELPEKLEQGKRAKIDAIVLSNKFATNDGSVSTSLRAQSLEELSSSPLRQRNRRRASREGKGNTESPFIHPTLKEKDSLQDLMFEMSDGEEGDENNTRKITPPRFGEISTAKHATQTPIGSLEDWSEARTEIRSLSHSLRVNRDSDVPAMTSPVSPATQQVRASGRPWGAAPLAGTKLDLRDIMAQTSTDKPSNLTLGLSLQEKEEKAARAAKLSQKERKRLQQVQQLGQPSLVEKPQPLPLTVSPWQAASHRKVTPTTIPVLASPLPPSRIPSAPQLTMRQTIANNGATSKQRDKQTPQQSRSVSGSTQTAQNGPMPVFERGMSVSTTPIPTPHSVRHIPLPSHSPISPSQQLSMNEILSIQQAEKDYVKDAAAKRSLQEIQQEQEFQQWWDLESKRVMQEEEQKKRADERAAKAGRGKSKNRDGRCKVQAKEKKNDETDDGRGKENRDASRPLLAQEAAASPNSTPTPTHDSNSRGRGGARPHRGGRGGARGGRSQGTGRGGRGGFQAAQAAVKDDAP